MELAMTAGFTVSEADLELYDAYTADEIILCSTAGGLLPAVWLDGRTVGDGKPGSAFTALRAAYDELVSSPKHGTDIPQILTKETA
jgi:branched-chain amino acid aminotransferase